MLFCKRETKDNENFYEKNKSNYVEKKRKRTLLLVLVTKLNDTSFSNDIHRQFVLDVLKHRHEVEIISNDLKTCHRTSLEHDRQDSTKIIYRKQIEFN